MNGKITLCHGNDELEQPMHVTYKRETVEILKIFDGHITSYIVQFQRIGDGVAILSININQKGTKHVYR